MGMADFSWVEKLGIAGVAGLILFFGYKMFVIFVQQWKQSTDAVNRNTKSFEKLSTVFEKQADRELKFQDTVLRKLEVNDSILRETSQRVHDIHGVVVHRRRKEDHMNDH